MIAGYRLIRSVMAETPNIEDPCWGYYVTSEFIELTNYVLAVLDRYDVSCIFTLHASALFERDGQEEELHMPALHPIILDPQSDHVVDMLENQYELCNEPDMYESINGSGFSLVPGTTRYWFKIYACQPNPTPSPSQQNISDYDISDNDSDNESGRSRSPINKPVKNTLFLAIGEAFMRANNIDIPRLVIVRIKTIVDWMKINLPQISNDADLEIDFTLQDLPEWHAELKILNIRVFSMCGNVLYAKKFADTSRWIDLYLNSKNRFAYVVKLNALFKRGLDRKICEDCNTFHRLQTDCKLKIVENEDEDVVVPEFPQGRHGLVVYSDFESIVQNDNKHITSGWAYCAITKDNEIYEQYHKNALNNDNIMEQYIRCLFLLAEKFTKGEDRKASHDCKICGENVGRSKDTVIGRNFINGEMGSHHIECWKDNKNCMYIFFHNFRGYDSHFLIEEVIKACRVLGISANSMEKFNLLRIRRDNNELINICFKDTFNFFTCSLAKCISMIEDWRYTPIQSRNAKGLFPYDWFDNIDKLNERELPPGPWYNKLTNQTVDSTPAQKEWEDNDFEEFHQYHDFYMVNDTVQLADAFEEFRRTCVKEFNIDPVHFQGAPGYTWYLGLKQNPDLFKIITDKKIYLDIQSQIRGGVSQAMTRYANVEDKPNESIFFLDINSLYSKCMTYKMPGRFLRKLNTLPDNWQELYASEGRNTAFICVDLVYPEHLHDRDWSYPLAPHKFNERLCTTFLRKEKYLVHAELLKFYLERGIVLEKVHYLYEFEQDYTLREYIENNILKRRATKSEVMKVLYKLLNNSLYGKTCENVFKYRKFDVIGEEKLQGGQINPSLYKARNMIQYGDKYLCEMKVEKVTLNKPIQIGFAILEFAKREMYRFLAAVTDSFGNDAIPLYTDTDSIMFKCNFDKPYLKFYNAPLLRPYLDFEKAPEHWNVKTHDTDKVSGLWSPEADGKEIVEYCGLRSKTYCYRFRDNNIVVKNKGIPKSAMIANDDQTPRDKITMQHYKEALFAGKEHYVSQYAIRSNRHQVSTVKLYKLGLSANDLKRAVLPDRITSIPFGYKGELFATTATTIDDPDNFNG